MSIHKALVGYNPLTAHSYGRSRSGRARMALLRRQQQADPPSERRATRGPNYSWKDSWGGKPGRQWARHHEEVLERAYEFLNEASGYIPPEGLKPLEDPSIMTQFNMPHLSTKDPKRIGGLMWRAAMHSGNPIIAHNLGKISGAEYNFIRRDAPHTLDAHRKWLWAQARSAGIAADPIEIDRQASLMVSDPSAQGVYPEIVDSLEGYIKEKGRISRFRRGVERRGIAYVPSMKGKFTRRMNIQAVAPDYKALAYRKHLGKTSTLKRYKCG